MHISCVWWLYWACNLAKQLSEWLQNHIWILWSILHISKKCFRSNKNWFQIGFQMQLSSFKSTWWTIKLVFFFLIFIFKLVFDVTLTSLLSSTSILTTTMVMAFPILWCLYILCTCKHKPQPIIIYNPCQI